MLDLLDEAVLAHVAVLEYLVHGEDGPRRQAQRDQLLRPLHLAAAREYRVQTRLDFRALAHAPGVVLELGMGDPVLHTEQLAKLHPHVLGGGGHVEGAVRGMVDAVGADHGVVVARYAGRVPQAQLALALHREQADQASQQGGFHQLTAAAGVARDHRPQHAQGAPHARRHVANRDAHPRGSGFRHAGEAHEPGHALRDLIHSRPRPVGSGGAKAGDGGEDQARVGRRELCVLHPHVLHGAGLEVLDEDVHVECQLAQQIQTRGVAEVHRDALLVAMDAQVVDALGLLERAPAADHLALGRGLDFDHLSAKVGEDHGAEGACESPREIEYAQPGERERVGGGGSCLHGVLKSFGAIAPCDSAAPAPRPWPLVDCCPFRQSAVMG